MERKRINNYDYFVYFFRQRMKELNILDSNALEEFVSNNMAGFKYNSTLMNHLCLDEQCEIYRDFYMFHNLWSGIDYTLASYPANQGFMFKPKDSFDLLDVFKGDLNDINKRVYNFRVYNGFENGKKCTVCRKEVANYEGLFVEKYNITDNEITTEIYSREDAIDAYSIDGAPKTGLIAYDYQLQANGFKSTYAINAFIDEDNVAFIKMMDSNGTTVEIEPIKMEPGMTLYELYNDFVERKVRLSKTEIIRRMVTDNNK